MDKISLYLQESYHELTKEVNWPTWEQLIESTIVVLSTAGVLAFVIFAMDFLCSVFFKTIYNIW
jgi:preprotein translocase subunit SecE